MRTLVTGAAGFVGRALTRTLAARLVPGDRLRLADLSPFDAEGHEAVVGDLADPVWLAQALEGVDRVVHLAALPGGAAEADPAASRRVNLDATLALLEALAGRPSPTRVVYASTIAVLGGELPAAGVDDDLAPRPAMTYGAHKLMVETALADWTRRGRLQGVALRLAGVVARPPGPSGLKSAFMSEIFHALAAGRPLELPVSAQATFWLVSARAAAQALAHGLDIDAPQTQAQALTLPALRVRADDLVGAVAAACGTSASLISYRPEPALEAAFGRLPPLSTPTAEALGFRRDGDLIQLVARVLGDLDEACP